MAVVLLRSGPGAHAGGSGTQLLSGSAAELLPPAPAAVDMVLDAVTPGLLVSLFSSLPPPASVSVTSVYLLPPGRPSCLCARSVRFLFSPVFLLLGPSLVFCYCANLVLLQLLLLLLDFLFLGCCSSLQRQEGGETDKKNLHLRSPPAQPRSQSPAGRHHRSAPAGGGNASSPLLSLSLSLRR